MLSALGGDLGRLRVVELFVGEVVLTSPIGTSHGTHSRLPKAYVHLEADEGEGWGEVAAIAQPVASDPSLADVIDHLTSRWIPRLFEATRGVGGACPPSHSVMLLGGSSPLDHVAGAALEMAVLDAELRAEDLSLSSWLGVRSPGVPYGGLVGASTPEAPTDPAAAAEALLAAGASRLRVKILPGAALGPLSAIRAMAPALALHADANGAFDLSSIEELHALDSLALRCLEQPLATRDLAATAQLAAALETPICLDESIVSRRAARDALRYGAARVLCLKPARLGGLRSTLAAMETARAHDAAWFIGGMFETGLGRALLAALAGLEGTDVISDVAAPSTYLEEDPCGLEGPSAGLQPLWGSPGVGPRPVGTALRRIADLRA